MFESEIAEEYPGLPVELVCNPNGREVSLGQWGVAPSTLAGAEPLATRDSFATRDPFVTRDSFVTKDSFAM